MVDYLSALEIQDCYSRGVTSITVEVMPRLTDEAKDLLEKIDFQILVRSPKVIRKKIENHSPQMENSPKRKPFKAILHEDKNMNPGKFSDYTHPKIKEEISNIIKRSKATRKKVGIFAGNFKEAEQWLREGLDMVVINSELGLMGQIIKGGLDKLKKKHCGFKNGQ